MKPVLLHGMTATAGTAGAAVVCGLVRPRAWSSTPLCLGPSEVLPVHVLLMPLAGMTHQQVEGVCEHSIAAGTEQQNGGQKVV